jgi:hypothetical protein
LAQAILAQAILAQEQCGFNCLSVLPPADVETLKHAVLRMLLCSDQGSQTLANARALPVSDIEKLRSVP